MTNTKLTDREKALIISYEIRETVDAMGLSNTVEGVASLQLGVQHLTKVLLPDLSLDNLTDLITEANKFSDEYNKYVHQLNEHPEVLSKGLHKLFEERYKIK